MLKCLNQPRLWHSGSLTQLHTTLCLQHLLLCKKYEKSPLLTDHHKIDRKTSERKFMWPFYDNNHRWILFVICQVYAFIHIFTFMYQPLTWAWQKVKLMKLCWCRAVDCKVPPPVGLCPSGEEPGALPAVTGRRQQMSNWHKTMPVNAPLHWLPGFELLFNIGNYETIGRRWSMQSRKKNPLHFWMN